MAVKEVKTYCRFCHAYCPMVATVHDNRLLGLAPDTDNPVYGGYTCVKGRQLAEQIYHPERLQGSLKRQADGRFEEISSAAAYDEIADKLRKILAEHGPRSIASYNGTYSYQNSASHGMARAFHQAIGSPSYYASVTIDQPAKVAIGPTRMGWWNGGSHMWRDADVSLLIGTNTLVSHFGMPGGIPVFSPANALREGKKRGVKIICVDPRRTEVAKRSDLHLQVVPGHDAALVAAIINVVIAEDLYDRAFCDEHTEGFEQLAAAVKDFTPERVARAAGIEAADLVEAARLFGRGPRGTASTGTGPEMGPHPNLLQHLIQCLNTICGRYLRAGEVMPNPGILTPPTPRPAQATGPQPQWLEDALRSRVSDDIREVTVLSPYGPAPEMPTAVLSDEILEPGEGQIRALICVGGNPLLAFPNEPKTRRALEDLELLVCIDIKRAATTDFADYILAPKICLEREDVTLLTDTWYDVPYGQYTQAVVEAEGDKVEEWEIFWEVGRRMGLALELGGSPLDMENKPEKFELLERITTGSRVPLSTLRDTDGGAIFDVPDVVVTPADPKTQERLALFPEGVAEEFAASLADLGRAGDADYPLLMVSRRMKYNYNSTGPELSLLGDKCPYNPAFLHSDELQRLGLTDGELVRVSSRNGSIRAIVKASDDVRPGVVSMAHCWGSSEDDDVATTGSNINRLIDNRHNNEKYSGIPRQSTVPVAVSPAS